VWDLWWAVWHWNMFFSKRGRFLLPVIIVALRHAGQSFGTVMVGPTEATVHGDVVSHNSVCVCVCV
jgi:hypothetical protein